MLPWNRARFPLVAVFTLASGCGTSSPASTSADAGVGAEGGVVADARDAGDAGGVPPSDASAIADDAGLGPCLRAEGGGRAGSATYRDGADETTITVTGGPCARTFGLATTAAQREGAPKTRWVSEREGWPSVSTKSEVFDALYTLALAEVREDSVPSIRDYAFQNGADLVCPAGGCFETGEKWNYVWTRDTAYATHLGLAALDPKRAANSLLFKLSPRRSGGEEEIVQDTGTGGSWPVSTDRIVWALGAYETAKYLTGAERQAFVDRAYPAIVRTLDRDRAVAFDARDGLYRGEQSFLDWREQTYPAWVTGDLAHVAQSRTLSTNVAHLFGLEIAAAFATERGDGATATRMRTEADALRARIRARFTLADRRLFSTMIPTELDPAPAARFDWLGTALAVIANVGTAEEGKAAVAAYPHLPKGPAVVWPQEQGIAIYHNRAIWPFVTAYGLEAAAKARNADVAMRAIDSLVRGSAIALSNMENFEAVTGKTSVDEGPTSGPVVNSRRQLWSVAGYVAMVHHVIFGLEASSTGLRVRPYVPKALRAGLLAGSDAVVLNDFPFHGKRVSVRLRFPAGGGAATGAIGAFGVGRVRLDGVEVGDVLLDDARLGPRSIVDVELTDGPDADAAQSATVVTDVADFKNVFAPKTPRIVSVGLDGARVRLVLDAGGERAGDVTFRLLRNGEVVAPALPGTTTDYLDTALADGAPTRCYALESRFASGNASHRSNPVCFWGAGGARIVVKGAAELTNVGGNLATSGGRSFFLNWGDPGHSLTSGPITASVSGDALVQITYANGAGGPTTGITCATKLVRVEEIATGALAGEGYAVMPHRGAWSDFGDSTFVRVPLVQGKSYRVVVKDDAKSVNMSAFAHFATYTAGTGGASGPFARADVAAIKILTLGGP